MRAQLRSNLEPRKVLGTRAVSRARAHPDHLEHFRVSLSPLEIIRRQVCLGVRPGCLERFRLFRGRLKSSRAARLSRAASGYLESTSGYLEPLEITWRQGCLGAGPGCLERFRLSRGRLELSRAARLSREGSGYLERSGYLEGGVGTTRASRWLGPFRMTRSAQDDSVRYETSHVPRHCKASSSSLGWLCGLTRMWRWPTRRSRAQPAGRPSPLAVRSSGRHLVAPLTPPTLRAHREIAELPSRMDTSGIRQLGHPTPRASDEFRGHTRPRGRMNSEDIALCDCQLTHEACLI